jgi:hypothetical protein
LRYELPFAALWVAGGAALGARQLKDLRSLVVGCLACAFAAAAWVTPGVVRTVMAHAHNAIALGVWALVFCQARKRALVVLVALAAATLLLVLSPLAWFGFKHGLAQSFGLHGLMAADQLAPFARGAPLALGIVASFAFLQSVHYAVWLHAIPQETTRGEGTLSFRMSFRAFLRDFGPCGAALAALLVVLVPLAGVMSPLRTQSIYLSLATFHAYLELAALALWWQRR